MSVKRYDLCHLGGGLYSMMEDSDGEFVRHVDHTFLEQKLTDTTVQLANAESKCRELAVENAGLNVFIEEECFVYSSDTPEPIDANDCKPETPATDAFLAEVRAQGVDEIAELYFTLAAHEANRSIADSWRESARFARDHAAQLRKGAEL